jgi:serine/threonine protein kinase
MGVTCCKEEKVIATTFQRIIADSESCIIWSRGELIGSGSFSRVYTAIDHNSNVFAVKCIPLRVDRLISQRIMTIAQSEVSILKSLDHPNIIKYYQLDFDIDLYELNILIEHAPRNNIRRFLEQFESVSLKVLQKLIREIVSALDYLHKKSILHRDLKCKNILISQDASVKLADFGLSKQINLQTKVYDIAGSLHWMAPEIVSKQSYSVAADIWSLGCTIIEMLTGKPPWSTLKSTRAVVKHIIAPDILPAIPDCDSDLKDFISQCLQKNPVKRPSAEALLTHRFLTEKICDSITREF